MDLSFVKEQLETFATFAGAIGDFLQKPVEVLQGLFDWFSTPEGADESNFSADWAETSSNLGSSDDTNGAEEGLSSKGDNDADSGLSSEDTETK